MLLLYSWRPQIKIYNNGYKGRNTFSTQMLLNVNSCTPCSTRLLSFESMHPYAKVLVNSRRVKINILWQLKCYETSDFYLVRVSFINERIKSYLIHIPLSRKAEKDMVVQIRLEEYFGSYWKSSYINILNRSNALP